MLQLHEVTKSRTRLRDGTELSLLSCYMGLFSSCSEPGLLFIVVCWFLNVAASLVLEHRVCGLPWLWHVGSFIAVPGFRTQAQ